MGMYTRLQLDVEVYPKYKTEILAYIESVPRLRTTSYYFYDRGQNFIEEDEHAKSIIEKGSRETAPMCVLHTDISCKNYGMEIQEFIKFLNGKVHFAGSYSGEHVGSIRYEEDTLPDLILQRGNQLEIRKIQLSS